MKISRAMVKQSLVNDLTAYFQVPVSKVQSIDDYPMDSGLRHSCRLTGITFLQPAYYRVVDDDGERQQLYYFCNCCGKLFMYNEYL